MNTADRDILRSLAACGSYALPEQTLRHHVNLVLAEPITLTTLRERLASLEAKGQVVSVQDEDRGTMWKITAQGRARLAS